jgi:8-oxo-dGTP pyrophosphatase MutT (NUDIX family)
MRLALSRAMSDRALPGGRLKGVQYAALPWRAGKDGLEVLLITSRETKRWVIPKGWPMNGKAPHEAAAREAFEEAGIVGETAAEAVGAYPYDKRLKDGELRPCTVEVFPMRVTKHKRVWPEKKQRRRGWFAAEDAAERVDEPELADLIRAFAAALPAS